MATETKSKTFLYKKARLQSKDAARRRAFNLGEALKIAALTAIPNAKDRRFQHGNDKDDVHALSDFTHHGAFRFGVIIDYTVGQAKAEAKIASAGKSIALDHRKPADKGSEWVDSIGFIGAQKNHVILAQTTSIKSLQFETYLNWLLRKAGLITNEEMVILADQPPPKDSKILNADNIKSINMGLQLISDAECKAAEVVKSHSAMEERTQLTDFVLQPKSLGWNALREIVGTMLGKELTMDSMKEANLIDVSMKLTFAKTSKGKKSTLMSSLATQLRHVDQEMDYEIELKKGGSITKTDMKIQHPFKIEVKDRALSPASVRNSMLHWLTSLLQSGRVVG